MNIGQEIRNSLRRNWKMLGMNTPEPILYLKPLNSGNRCFYSFVSSQRISLKDLKDRVILANSCKLVTTKCYHAKSYLTNFEVVTIIFSF
jgi:hypothetical protein